MVSCPDSRAESVLMDQQVIVIETQAGIDRQILFEPNVILEISGFPIAGSGGREEKRTGRCKCQNRFIGINVSGIGSCYGECFGQWQSVAFYTDLQGV